jgi:hypothetical protein
MKILLRLKFSLCKRRGSLQHRNSAYIADLRQRKNHLDACPRVLVVQRPDQRFDGARVTRVPQVAPRGAANAIVGRIEIGDNFSKRRMDFAGINRHS